MCYRDRMIALPEWESGFVRRSRRYTRRLNTYAAARFFVVLAIPWVLALASFWGLGIVDRSFVTIALFFATVLVLFVAEKAAWAIKHRQKRRTISALLHTVPELALLCGLCVYWWLLFPGHIALAIGAWWAFGFLLALWRYAWRRWALADAILQTKDYRLFGRRTGRSVKRAKHDRASLHVLAKDSAFRPCTIMVLATDEPDIYVGSEVRSQLEADQLRSLIAHELGHSWSQHHVGCELAGWVRRMFFVPFLGWLASMVLAAAPAKAEPILVCMFLTSLTLIWKANGWAANLLNRPIELGADLYALEMTRTPEAFVEGMKRLAELDRHHVFPNLFDTLGFCSHPCIVKRLEYVAAALEKASGEPGAGKRRRGTNS